MLLGYPMILKCFGNKELFLTSAGISVKNGQQFIESLGALTLPEAVAIIKVGAQTKGDNMEARENILTNNYARKTALTETIALLIPQGTNSLI